eukprot:Gb_29819 [translate_table: standard]
MLRVWFLLLLSVLGVLNASPESSLRLSVDSKVSENAKIGRELLEIHTGVGIPVDSELSENDEISRELLDIHVGVGIGIGIGGGGGWQGNAPPPPLLPPPPPGFCGNARLYQAYVALQAWKKAITDDPLGILNNWVGSDVCNYTGVFCAPPPDKSVDQVVAGIDLNHAILTGTLVEELGLLNDSAIFHINTNYFCGSIPLGIKNLYILTELDLSNNQFSGYFPSVVLTLPKLVFLDIRFNNFQGTIPAELFNRNLDAIFVNNNNFEEEIPATLGNSPVSVLNFANNKLSGSIPSSVCNMAETVNEVLFLNNRISGCLPDQIGFLKQVTVFDVSFNNIGGQIPLSVSCLESVEQINLAHNQFYGPIPDVICSVRRLNNLTVANNYFSSEGISCPNLLNRGIAFDDRQNCIPNRPFQRSPQECVAFAAGPKTCTSIPSPELPCILPPPLLEPPPPALRYPSPPPPAY